MKIRNLYSCFPCVPSALRRPAVFVGLLLCCGSLYAQSVTTLLDENFTSPDRREADLPSHSAWFSSTDGSTVSYGSGKLTQATGASRFVLSYFTAAAPVSLKTGESLQISFDFSVTDPASVASGLRIGVYNSGGQRISADNRGTANDAYVGYKGYTLLTNPVATADNQTSFFRRNGTNSAVTTLIGTTTGSTRIKDGGTQVDGALSANTVYSGTILLTRTADSQIDLSFSINGLSGFSISGSNSGSTALFDFDTFVFANQGGGTSSFTLENVTVTHKGVIPEAGHVASMTVLLVAGVLLCSRRLHRRG